MRSTDSQPGDQPANIATNATPLLMLIALVAFAIHMLTAGNYGYFRDELYYIADGEHLQLGYVDQPLMMGLLAALLRITTGDNLVALHVLPALACTLITGVTGLLAREFGGGRMAQLVAAVAALMCVAFLAAGSIFSMDVLDQLWWALASLVLARMLRLARPRLWLLVGLIVAVALLTKLTVLFLGCALAVALLLTPERRALRTRWPWLAATIAVCGLVPYVVWNARNGWPTVDFYLHYSGVGSSLPAFLSGQLGLMNPLALPLVLASVVFFVRPNGERFRLLGWTVLLVAVLLATVRTKTYFFAPALPILFAAGAVQFEQWSAPRWLDWLRPAYIILLSLVGVLLAPDVMPIFPPAATAHAYGSLTQPLADRLGWDTLTSTVELTYASLPPSEQAQACVFTSNYGEAGALQQLGAPGKLPPVISGHNNYYLWGPGACSGQVLIGVGFQPGDFQRGYASIHVAATHTCALCVEYEQEVPIIVATDPKVPSLQQLWPMVKHFD